MSWGSSMMMAAAGHHQLGWGMVELEGWRKGPWTAEEDRLLIEYVKLHGEGRWNSVSRLAGLKRNGKSCRLRWVNYLRPDLKRGQITPHEEKIIVDLHARWGNRWSTIARSLPGRTDNEIKNYWRTHFKKKVKGSSPSSSDLHSSSEKSKARLLKRQQFHLQQQQQLLQQQTHDHPHTFDMKKLTSFLDETHDNVNKDGSAAAPPVLPNHYYYYSSSSSSSGDQHDDHHQGFLCYSMFNSYASAAVPEGIATDQDMNIWDGLWNMDDVNGGSGGGNINYTRNGLYYNYPSAATPFC